MSCSDGMSTVCRLRSISKARRHPRRGHRRRRWHGTGVGPADRDSARGTTSRGHTGGVYAVAVGEVDGTPVAVTGGRDGTVRVWDLRTGTARGEPLRGHADGVQAVAVGEVDGTPVAVTGGHDGTVQVWDLRTGTARGKPLRGHTDSVWAVAVGEVDGTPVAVTGGRDGTVRVWDLRTGRQPAGHHFAATPTR